MIILILLIILCSLISLIPIKYNKETFTETKSNFGSKPYETEKKIYTGTMNSTFNGRMAIDDQYFYDKLFDNVTYYPNKYDKNYELGDVIANGWELCKQDCPGNCVEYGQTGNSYCFTT